MACHHYTNGVQVLCERSTEVELDGERLRIPQLRLFDSAVAFDVRSIHQEFVLIGSNIRGRERRRNGYPGVL